MGGPSRYDARYTEQRRDGSIPPALIQLKILYTDRVELYLVANLSAGALSELRGSPAYLMKLASLATKDEQEET